MNAPAQFCFLDTFRHRSPEFVRQVLRRHDFRQVLDAQGFSEIWVRDAGIGHWLVRLDSAGHDVHRHFGSRPHYHKNWIETEAALEKYVSGPSNQAVWIYSDAGLSLGPAGKSNPLHRDKLAKLQHISR